MKNSMIVYICLITLNVFSFNNLHAEEFSLIFSLNDLEKYLGEPVPENAQQSDSNYWIIELYNDNFIRKNINLLSENNIVIVAEYIFTSQSKSWLSSLHEYLFYIIDEQGERKTSRNNVMNWEIQPNSGLRNNRHLYIGLTNVYNMGNKNNEMCAFSARILDLGS
jgi:hypothetical protein